MSYMMDIDEYQEESLQRELDMRKRERERGLCDYCHRGPRTKPCRMTDRHNDGRIMVKPSCPSCLGSGRNEEDKMCEPCQGKGIRNAT